jgi:hypothetical protein
MINGDNLVVIHNVLVGQVWVGAGQGSGQTVVGNQTSQTNPAKYTEGSEFALWSKYEDIAMHFNSLLMQLRVQALAALAGVVTISGLALGFAKEQTRRIGWRVLSGAMGFLVLAWVALWILDLGYYDRLLQGVVHAITEHEDRTPLLVDGSGKQISIDNKPVHTINASTRIKANSFEYHWVIICVFYSLVLIGLAAGAFFTWKRAGNPEESPTLGGAGEGV